LFDAGAEQGPTGHIWIQFYSVVTGGSIETEMSGATPFLYFANLLTVQIKFWNPFPVATT
jgi:hypothetical protein